MYYVYVLKSFKDNNLYIGYSEDLQTRIATHHKGREGEIFKERVGA
jgi:predicted GIY-YIG superfamily endonuclease